MLMLVSANVYSQERIKDVRTNPEKYFLKIDDVANSFKLLPPPPQPGSTGFSNDEARYLWGKMQRDTPRGDQASADAHLSGDGVPDAGDLSTRAAKNYYMRTRPYAYYKEMTCNPKDQEKLSTNGSYPSGHTAIGWATALVLSEINTERQNEILIRGFEIGQSRVICGYHWQSDVDAARIVASAVVARLHADKQFAKQVKKAKKEFRRLNRKGLVKKSNL